MLLKAPHAHCLWFLCLALTICCLLGYCIYPLTSPSSSFSLSPPRARLLENQLPLTNSWTLADAGKTVTLAGKDKEFKNPSLSLENINSRSPFFTKIMGLDPPVRNVITRTSSPLKKMSVRSIVPFKIVSTRTPKPLKNVTTRTHYVPLENVSTSSPLKYKDTHWSLSVKNMGNKVNLQSKSLLPQRKRGWNPLHGTFKRTSPRNDSFTATFLSSLFLMQNSSRKENTRHQHHTHADAHPARTKLVLFYNMPTWFLSQGRMDFRECSAQSCLLTTNRSLLHLAGVVIFHIFFFRSKLPPKHRPRGQIWVAFGLEAPYALGTNMLTPEWRGVFNWTMTYRLDSDLFAPYGRLVYRGTQNKNYTQMALTKRRSAAWFVSNCRTSSQRLAYVRELQKHYPVDIFGRCGPLQCPLSNNSLCMSLLNSTYRFYLSFESSFCRDYVTEKFFKLFKPDFHIIPIVRGGSQYRKFFPAGTFVDVSEFKSPLGLGKYLKKLESDADQYAAMLREKDKYYAEVGRKLVMCELCEKLHLDSTPKVYPNIAAWLTNGACWTPA